MAQQTSQVTIPTSGSFQISIVQVSQAVWKVEFRWYPQNVLTFNVDPCIASPMVTTAWNSSNNNYDATITWDDGISPSPKPPLKNSSPKKGKPS